MESTAAAVLLVCDIQERFKGAIWHFDIVAQSAAFLADVCTELGIEAIATEQMPEKLGHTVDIVADALSRNAAAIEGAKAAAAAAAAAVAGAELDDSDDLDCEDEDDDEAADGDKTGAAASGASAPQMKPLVAVAKSAFSMLVPAVRGRLAAMAREGQNAASAGGPSLAGLTVVLVGIESHVCVQQTACALLALGARVLVPADGVSASRPAEHFRAMRHLAARGADVVSCESVAFELLGSAAHPAFRAVHRLVKDRAAAMDCAEELLGGSAA